MIKTFTGNEGIRNSAGNLLYGLVVMSSIRQQAITVGVTAIPLPTTPMTRRISLEILNNSTGGQILYIGDSTVTTVNGRPIYPRAGMNLQIEDNVDIYGVSSAVGADIRVTEGN